MFSKTLEICRAEERLERYLNLADGTCGLISWLCLGVRSSAGPQARGLMGTVSSALGVLETTAFNVFGVDSWRHS